MYILLLHLILSLYQYFKVKQKHLTLHEWRPRDISNDPLTRERLISTQKEDQELTLPCSKSFSVEEVDKLLSALKGNNSYKTM